MKGGKNNQNAETPARNSRGGAPEKKKKTKKGQKKKKHIVSFPRREENRRGAPFGGGKTGDRWGDLKKNRGEQESRKLVGSQTRGPPQPVFLLRGAGAGPRHYEGGGGGWGGRGGTPVRFFQNGARGPFSVFQAFAEKPFFWRGGGGSRGNGGRDSAIRFEKGEGARSGGARKETVWACAPQKRSARKKRGGPGGICGPPGPRLHGKSAGIFDSGDFFRAGGGPGPYFFFFSHRGAPTPHGTNRAPQGGPFFFHRPGTGVGPF